MLAEVLARAAVVLATDVAGVRARVAAAMATAVEAETVKEAGEVLGEVLAMEVGGVRARAEAAATAVAGARLGNLCHSSSSCYHHRTSVLWGTRDRCTNHMVLPHTAE